MKELLFAQRLADNEKRVRDRALKKLKKYLSVKSSAGSALSQDEALKLWKGLFYCMYMADKPLVQESVAEDISGLIHYIHNEEDCKTFVKTGFLTLAREWNGIDVFRIEKYMMFVRRFLRHIFGHLQACEWSLQEVLAYTYILEITVVCPDDDVNKTPLGLKTHVCEIILEELAKIGGENLQHSVIMAVIQPYLKVLALTKITSYCKFVREGIIHHLIDQSLGAEEEEEEKETEEANKADLETGNTGVEDVELEGREEVSVMLDPRAGRVDTYIPQLKVDFNLLADSLQKIGAVSRVQAKNREMIYKLVCDLRDAAQGYNPLLPPSDHIDDVDVPETEVEMAVERLEKFEEDLRMGKASTEEDNADDLEAVRRQDSRKYKKKKYFALKKKHQRPMGLSKSARRKLEKRHREVAKKRAKAVEHMVRQVTAASGVPRHSVFRPSHETQADTTCGFEVSLISQKIKPSTVAKASSSSFMVEEASDVKKKRQCVDSTNRASKKQCFDVSTLNLNSIERSKTSCSEKNDNAHASAVTEKQTKTKSDCPSKKSKKKLVKSKGRVHGETKTDGSIQQSNKPTSVQEGDKPVQKSKVKTLPDTTVHQQSVQPSRHTETKAKVSKDGVPPEKGTKKNISEGTRQDSQSSRTPTRSSPWDEPLQNGEYEVFIKSRKQIMRSKKKKINPIKKRLTASIPKQRTISINLKKNKEHEFSDYVRTLRASPSIPFRADQAPKAPVLKPSPSPILVKGPLLRRRLQKAAAVSASPQLNHKKMRQTAADFF